MWPGLSVFVPFYVSYKWCFLNSLRGNHIILWRQKHPNQSLNCGKLRILMMVTICMIKIGLKMSNKCILCFRCQLSESCYNKQLVFQSSTTVGLASIGKHRSTYPVSMSVTPVSQCHGIMVPCIRKHGVVWHYFWGDLNKHPPSPDKVYTTDQSTVTTEVPLGEPWVLLGLFIGMWVRGYLQGQKWLKDVAAPKCPAQHGYQFMTCGNLGRTVQPIPISIG